LDSSLPKFSDAQLAQLIQVGIRELVAFDLLLAEALVVPHVQMVELTDHCHFAAHRRGVPELRGNQDPTLSVDAHLLTKVIGAVKELPFGLVGRRQRCELLLHLAPDRKRVDLGELTIQTGHEEIRTVRFQLRLEGGRNLKSTLGVHGCHMSAPERGQTFHEFPELL